MGDGQAVASGAAFQGLAKVEVELGRVICAPRRWRPRSVEYRPDMVLPAQVPGEAPIERLPVREGEPADQTPKIIPQIQVPLLI